MPLEGFLKSRYCSFRYPSVRRSNLTDISTYEHEIITNEIVPSIVLNETLTNKTSLAKNVNLEGSSKINTDKGNNNIISKWKHNVVTLMIDEFR